MLKDVYVTAFNKHISLLNSHCNLSFATNESVNTRMDFLLYINVCDEGEWRGQVYLGNGWWQKAQVTIKAGVVECLKVGWFGRKTLLFSGRAHCWLNGKQGLTIMPM